MNDNEGEDLPAGSAASFAKLEQEWAQSSPRFQELARVTQNPVYAWIALLTRFRSIVGVAHDRPLGEEVSIPGWVARYLMEVAEDLETLSCGSDFRLPHEPMDFGVYSSWQEAVDSPELAASVEKRRISMDKAMTLVPAALGLTRDGGWNAFGSLVATAGKMQDALAYADMRAKGVPSKIALHLLASRHGIEDPSHMHRRLREGRKLAGLDKDGVAEPDG